MSGIQLNITNGGGRDYSEFMILQHGLIFGSCGTDAAPTCRASPVSSKVCSFQGSERGQADPIPPQVPHPGSAHTAGTTSASLGSEAEEPG